MRRPVMRPLSAVWARAAAVGGGVAPPSMASPTTSAMEWDEGRARRPMLRWLLPDGSLDSAANVSVEELTRLKSILNTMVKVRAVDKVLLDAQRQGRLSFYMTSTGEEATSTATAEGLAPTDEAYLQYREVGFCVHRGITIQSLISQCMGNIENPQKGRQMPVHYGSAEKHIQMISSPLGTQIPQAAGAGYGMRIAKENRTTVCFLGEGAASEGDFHAGLNFAATLRCRTIFVVRNNGFAISTPMAEQFITDGIVERGRGYGIPSLRVDGNDALAVLRSVEQSRALALKNDTPVLLELMSYRASHHSTSDDSTRYRSAMDIDSVMNSFCPISRLEKLLVSRDLWNPMDTARIMDETTDLCRSELQRQENLPPWPVSTMVDDVFAEPTPHLREQMTEMLEHYEKNADKYVSNH